jgi:predicted small secreted protein
MRRSERVTRVAAVLLALFLASCNAFEGLGDKDSREAKLEEARIAMDKGDFQTAVDVLAALEASYPGDAEISRAMADALMGRAGLNFFDLAAKAQNAADNASLSDVVLITDVFPQGASEANIADDNNAILRLQSLLSGGGNADDWFALALAKLTRACLSILVYGTGKDVNGIPHTFTNPPMTDAVAQQIRDDIGGAVTDLGPGRADLDPDSEILKSLIEIRTGIDAASGADVAAKVRAYLSVQFN